MKEIHNSMEYLLSARNYQDHNWLICGDLTGLTPLGGGGYIKYSCFLCLWNSQDEDKNYVRQEWPTRQGENLTYIKFSLTLLLNRIRYFSIFTYQVRTNEELCESNEQGR